LDELAALESARLLVPDHEGKYRPKLVVWGKKVAYLIKEGWTVAEIKRWSKGRWQTPNPKLWPPDREDWSESDKKGIMALTKPQD
jgi:hypothetical protein